MRTERYESNGNELGVDIFQPSTGAGRPRPAILFFHGGGWRGGDRAQFHPQCERFAAAAFVAATAQYRLGVTIAACVEDAAAAFGWLRSHADSLGVDPDRIAVAGGSAGGHLALCLASCPGSIVSPRVMAVVAFNPGVDIVSLQGGANILPAGTDPTAISPLHHVDALTSPVLIQHGTDDQFFPIEVIRRFRDSAARCELIEYEGAAHGFFNRRVSEEHFEATTSAAVAFLRRIAEPQNG